MQKMFSLSSKSLIELARAVLAGAAGLNEESMTGLSGYLPHFPSSLYGLFTKWMSHIHVQENQTDLSPSAGSAAMSAIQTGTPTKGNRVHDCRRARLKQRYCAIDRNTSSLSPRRAVAIYPPGDRSGRTPAVSGLFFCLSLSEFDQDGGTMRREPLM